MLLKIKKYFPTPGISEDVKNFPLEIDFYPGDFYDPVPDLIIIKLEVNNPSQKEVHDVTVGALVRYQCGKLISTGERIDVDQSKKGSQWRNPKGLKSLSRILQFELMD